MNTENVIGCESGYEIHRIEDLVLFAYRKTFGVGLASCIFGGLALMSGVWTIIALGMGFSGKVKLGSAFVASGILATLFTVILVIAISSFKAYRKRKNLALDQIPHVLEIDLQAKVLRYKGGADICALQDVRITDSLSLFDHSRGLMRVMILTWPSGKARIFKSNSSREIKRITKALNETGIGETAN